MNIPLISSNAVNINMNNTLKASIPSNPFSAELKASNNLKDNTDTVSISVEAKDTAKKEDALASTKEGFYTAMELLKNLNETTEDREDGFAERLKCIKIALRIIKGDKVPLKDMAFLAEKEPAMYSNAILLKRNNDNPQKHKSLINDKKDNGATDSPDAGTPSATVTPETIAGDSINVGDIEVTMEPES